MKQKNRQKYRHRHKSFIAGFSGRKDTSNVKTDKNRDIDTKVSSLDSVAEKIHRMKQKNRQK